MRSSSKGLLGFSLSAGVLAAGLLAGGFATSRETPDPYAKSAKIESIIHARAFSVDREVVHPEFGRLVPMKYGESLGGKPRLDETSDPRVILASAP